MKLNPEPFEKIASGKKTIELRLYDEKRKQVKPNDEIIFTHTESPYRSIGVIVDSVVMAASFELLFKHISLSDCGFEESEINGENHLDMNRYYSEEKQAQYGVVGIKFSLNERRVLSDIHVPYIQIKNYVEHLIEVNSTNYKGLSEWYEWHCESRWKTPDHETVEDIISVYDNSIREWIYDKTLDLKFEIMNHGCSDYYDYYDRPFRLYECFPESEFWEKARYLVVEYFAGCFQYELCPLKFDIAFEDD